MSEQKIEKLNLALGIALGLFCLLEVNLRKMQGMSGLAVFSMFGIALCFLNNPLHERLKDNRYCKIVDYILAALTVVTFMYVVVQSEEVFKDFWLEAKSESHALAEESDSGKSEGVKLGDRAGAERDLDHIFAGLALVLILEATRRAIGYALPILALIFVGYAYYGSAEWIPDWAFPHRDISFNNIVAKSYSTVGVFGAAARVMFNYVFPFVLFGAFLQATGATQFIIDFARRLFGHKPGGPAKVSVVSSGLMGSLSGSAVANTATTGTFTIPLMRSSGFKGETAAGIEAAASSGGALVPPVMGAGAYMMLEVLPVRADGSSIELLDILRAAVIPAIIYYLSLFMIVHFYSRRIGGGTQTKEERKGPLLPFEGCIFFSAFAVLVVVLFLGRTVMQAVSLALAGMVVISFFNKRTRLSKDAIFAAIKKAAIDSIPLVTAAACVGIILGVVLQTGVGSKLPMKLLPLAQNNLFAALVMIMGSSILLGMGLPSSVCYLLLVTIIGDVLGKLGVPLLCAHFFIFYFGMMSMVTPPVALAAYTAASIAGTNIIKTSFAAFRFALVGFTLPYMFVFDPALLMLDAQGGTAGIVQIAVAVICSVLGIIPFAAGIAGYLFGPLGWPLRAVLFIGSALLLLPNSFAIVDGMNLTWLDVGGAAVFGVVCFMGWRARGEEGHLEV